MKPIRDNIDAFLAESGIPYKENPPGSGNFYINDYRPDGTPFITAASTDEYWVYLASGVTPDIKGKPRAVAGWMQELLRKNAERPLAQYGVNKNGGLVLTSNYPAHVHSERFFSDNLIDIRNAQSQEVPDLLREGQKKGLDFGFPSIKVGLER